MGQSAKLLRSGTFWIVLSYLLLLPIFFRPTLHGVDPVGYFSWLRSAVVEGSLDIANEFETLGIYRDYNYQNITLPTGFRYNQWSAGPALLWAPLYAAVHGAAALLHSVGVAAPTSGYEAPYLFVTAWSTTLYTLVGVWLVYDIARRSMHELVAALGVITVWLASPLLFYTYSSPFMSHALDFFAGALFLWVWQRTRPATSGWSWFWRGVVFGLCIFVRVQNVLLGGVLAFALLWNLLATHASWWKRIQMLLRNGLALGAGAAVLLAPLMLFWKVVYGAWVYNTYAITSQLDGIHMDLWRPRLLSLAFSNDHGLFFWSPVLLFSVIGLLYLLRQDLELGMLLIGVAALQFYFVSTLTNWNGGGPSFGARLLSGTLPSYAVGMAFFLHSLHGWLRIRWLALLCSVFIIWNFLLIVQYAMGTIPRSGAIDPVQLWRSQWSVVPDNLERIINILLTRRAS